MKFSINKGETSPCELVFNGPTGEVVLMEGTYTQCAKVYDHLAAQEREINDLKDFLRGVAHNIKRVVE